MKNLLLISLFLLLSSTLMAQERIAIEITAGAASTFSKGENSINGSNVPMESKIGVNAGLSLLFPISKNWQWYSEIGFYPNALRNGIKNPTGDFSVYYSRDMPALLPSFSLGARYNFKIKNLPLYVQPGLVLSTSTSLGAANEYFEGGLSTLEQVNKLGMAFRVDLGTKIMTKKDNYFVVGLRYQQGLTDLNRYTNPLMSNGTQIGTVTENTRGSFIGVFAGYGIKTGKWKRSSKKK